MLETTKFNPYGDKGYKMKNNYDADKLIVANFERISSEATMYGPMVETTEQKYLFEIYKINGSEIKYREIFTGFIANDKEKFFDLPYVVNPHPFTDYFPETKGTKIPKLSLLWAQNDINYSKKDIKELKKENYSQE